jgi:transposase
LSDTVSRHVSAPVSFHLLEAEPTRLDVSPARTHRVWSDAGKARIIEESLAPGAKVSRIARAHGVAASQIYGWRRQAIASGAVRRRDDIGFSSGSGHGAPGADHVEICMSGVVLRVGGNVGEDHLRRVLRAVRTA